MARDQYRTSTGKRILLKRNKRGQFIDVQDWKNVIRADRAKSSKIERISKTIKKIEVLLAGLKKELS